MAVTWDEVAAIAAQAGLLAAIDLPERRVWVGQYGDVAWERPLSKKDLKALAGNAPVGDVLALRTAGLVEKARILVKHVDSCFDSLHFKSYPAILIDLGRVTRQELLALFIEAANLPPGGR